MVLKTLDTTHDESGDFFERFLKEGRIIASLRHPHIVTIFDIGTADDVVYIAMEYVDGGDLRAKIENRLAPVRSLELDVQDHRTGSGVRPQVTTSSTGT